MKKMGLSGIMLLGLVIASAASATQVLTYTGNIASGAQFDLYPILLRQGETIVATLVCDFDGVSRPLDPVLSAVLPGGDSSDTIFADFYNDDGFGTDDDPNGVDCDAFDSSRLIFVAPVAGQYVFRVDGFGSSTGPYTLRFTFQHLGVPALGTVGLGLFAALLGAGGLLRLRRRQATLG